MEHERFKVQGLKKARICNRRMFFFNKNSGKEKSWCIIVLAGICALVSCTKKEEVYNDQIRIELPADGTVLQKILDSLYFYAKGTYLWHDALPGYEALNPRQYAKEGTDMEALRMALSGITSLAVNPATQQPYEYRQGYSRPLYSYIAEGNIFKGTMAAVTVDGQGNDMGIGTSIINGNDVYISYVETGSPAFDAGIARGMMITGIDGLYVPLNSNNIAAALAQEQVGLNLKKQDGSGFHVNLQKKQYEASPVLKAAVLQAGAEKTGYVAIARFSNLVNAREYLDGAFDQFASKNITSMIVDLRYNNGGYVETAEYMANLLAPAAADGKVMYEEHYNDLLQKEKASLVLATIPYLDNNGQQVYINGRLATYADVDFSVSGNTFHFSKKGALSSIKKIIFIVSSVTASASELLINSLKPYVDVQLVGSQTYGKPVGTFGIGINKYTLYLAQFRIVNAAGSGDYYNGLPVDVNAVDDVTKDFGDVEENCLSKAMTSLHNSANLQLSTFNKADNLQIEKYEVPSSNSTRYMIENRLHIK